MPPNPPPQTAPPGPPPPADPPNPPPLADPPNRPPPHRPSLNPPPPPWGPSAHFYLGGGSCLKVRRRSPRASGVSGCTNVFF